jgi:hypothetical protein
MDIETKRLVGRVLGEIYKMKKQLKLPRPDDATVYGLLNGIDEAISEHLDQGAVTDDEMKLATELLSNIWNNPAKLAAFKGYYDIEDELRKRGLDRGKMITILTFLNARGRFHELIVKMNSEHSPAECKKFDTDL